MTSPRRNDRTVFRPRLACLDYRHSTLSRFNQHSLSRCRWGGKEILPLWRPHYLERGSKLGQLYGKATVFQLRGQIRQTGGTTTGRDAMKRKLAAGGAILPDNWFLGFPPEAEAIDKGRCWLASQAKTVPRGRRSARGTGALFRAQKTQVSINGFAQTTRFADRNGVNVK